MINILNILKDFHDKKIETNINREYNEFSQ